MVRAGRESIAFSLSRSGSAVSLDLVVVRSLARSGLCRPSGWSQTTGQGRSAPSEPPRIPSPAWAHGCPQEEEDGNSGDEKEQGGLQHDYGKTVSYRLAVQVTATW